MSRQERRHQQVVEDLVNDLLCSSSSFVLTTPQPAPQARRRRQRPLHLASPPRAASCIPLDSPHARGPSVPPAVASAEAAQAQQRSSLATTQRRAEAPDRSIDPVLFGKTSNRASTRRLEDGRGVSRGPTPTTSPNLRLHSRRRISTSCPDFSPLARLSVHSSPLAPAPRHKRVCVECAKCASRIRSDGKVHHAKADTREHDLAMRQTLSARPQSLPAHSPKHFSAEPLQPPRSLRPLPTGLPRAPSLRNVAAGLRSVHLRSAALAVIATFPLPRAGLGRAVSNADVALIQWEHHLRLEQAVQRRESGASLRRPVQES